MNEFLSIFITWQFLVLCVGITAITFIFKTIIEYSILNNPNMPGNSRSRFWRDLVLPLLPIILGVLFAIFAKSFPYPAVMTEIYSKFLFGISAGLLSPTLYRVIRAMLWKNVGNNDTPISPFPQPVFPTNTTEVNPTDTNPVSPTSQSEINSAGSGSDSDSSEPKI